MSTQVGVGLRVVAAFAAGAAPAARTRSRVVHLYVGKPSRSGRYASTKGRVVCGVRCLRLPLLSPGSDVADLGGRRFCRRCTSLVPTSLGTDVHRLVAREDIAAAYGHLTIRDLRTAARWTTSVDDTHLVARVAAVVLGPPKMFGRRSADEQAVFDLDRFIIRRRDQLRARELTAEEIEDRRARQEADSVRDAAVLASRRKSDAMDRALDRRNRGAYLTPWERQLVNTA